MRYLACVLIGLAVGLAARAERVPLSEEDRKAEATHIVTGVVKASYDRDVQTTLYDAGTVEVRHLIEIEIRTVEKGGGLKPGELLYVRTWNVKKRGAHGLRPGPSGHGRPPAEGTLVRAYVAKGAYGPVGQTDNGWAVVYPNGMDELPPAKKP